MESSEQISLYYTYFLDLPQEIHSKVLEYGDPNQKQKNDSVIRQLNYLRNEYSYLQSLKSNCFYQWSNHYIYLFLLIRNSQKNQLNYGFKEIQFQVNSYLRGMYKEIEFL